jgi:uncharacterized protein with ATP-grasp and redox domains
MIDQVATVRTIPFNKGIVAEQGYNSLDMYGEFLSAARKADLVVAKGQANYSLLASLRLGAFYLFVHKCPVITRAEKANMGEAVLMRV